MSDKTLSFTQRSLAEALDNVRHLSDLGPEMIAEQVFAASAQQPAVAVQDGWKLVPVEPTLEMLNEIQLLPQFTREALDARYRAMLAAAPAAPVAVGREPVARAFGKVCGGDAEHNTVNVRVSGPVPPELWTIGTAVALYAAPPATQNPTGDSASPVAEQPLPHWAPCNPACDPELNGSMSKLCDCAQAKSALGDQSAAAPVSPAAQEPAEDAGLAFSALPCAGFWRWLHRCNRVPAAAEQPDTVAVPRGLLEHLAGSPDLDPDCCAAYYRRQLRALLGKEGEA